MGRAHCHFRASGRRRERSWARSYRSLVPRPIDPRRTETQRREVREHGAHAAPAPASRPPRANSRTSQLRFRIRCIRILRDQVVPPGHRHLQNTLGVTPLGRLGKSSSPFPHPRRGPWWRWHMLRRPVRRVQQFAVPCSSIKEGVWKLRKQLRQPRRSSRRATTHSNPTSTVGSSPGVVEKRILGMFSFRMSDGRLSAVLLSLGAATDGGASGSSGSPHPRQDGASDVPMRCRGHSSARIFVRRHEMCGLRHAAFSGPQGPSSGLWWAVHAGSCF
jgi:hypothetical protein